MSEVNEFQVVGPHYGRMAIHPKHRERSRFSKPQDTKNLTNARWDVGSGYHLHDATFGNLKSDVLHVIRLKGVDHGWLREDASSFASHYQTGPDHSTVHTIVISGSISRRRSREEDNYLTGHGLGGAMTQSVTYGEFDSKQKKSEAYEDKLVRLEPISWGNLRGRRTGPVQLFAKLLENWELNENDGAKLLGYDDAKSVRDLLSGAASLRARDVKDRIRYLLMIDAALDQLFQDEVTERDWLREERVELGGKNPLSILLEGSMENVLIVKQFVEHISGL